MNAKLDVAVEDHGSLWLFRPLTEDAKIWIDDNVQDAALWFGGALAVEARFVQEMVEGMLADGLEVGR
jgi:hypothetical protein